MEEEEKASQSPRPQRSKLHLWGCSGVSFKAWQTEPYSRYKHIYILKPFHLFLLWLYNIPWWPDMAAECYTESWRDIKMKKNKKKRKKKRRSDEIVRGGGVERGEGLMVGDPVLLQFVGLPVALPCPLWKCCTRWSNTQFLHLTAAVICSEGV